jgi:SAM-dependent methyltransferase
VEHDDDGAHAAFGHDRAVVDVPWRCPRCRGALTDAPASLRCAACGTPYDVVDGIPDLRVPTQAWVDFDRDKAEARRLAALPGASAGALARDVFRSRPHWTDARVELRTRQVLEAPQRARREIESWLAPAAAAPGPLLEIGCGTGGLLAALPSHRESIGIDVSLAWLVVAKRLLAEHGRSVPLAAAVAEALPLGDASAGAIVALDVIEHVADLVPVLREMDRVAAPGAALAFATPNRYSLGAEPHVGVWGVGWLPRSAQPRYVKWRTGEPYTFARLLSAREALGLVRAHTRFDASVEAPPIPAEEIARFGSRRALLARTYNALSQAPGLRRVFVAIGPFFHVTGRKRSR